MTPAYALLLVDAQLLFAEGLRAALISLWPMASVAIARGPDEAAELLLSKQFDAVIANWETLETPARLQELVEAAGAAPVLVTAHRTDRATIGAIMDVGARGLLPKTMTGEAIRGAVVVALSGGSCFPRHSMCDAPPQTGSVSVKRGRRELQVLSLLAHGLSNKAISRELGISIGTVKLHVQSILRSTNARSRLEAVTNARRMGLLSAAA